MERVNIVIRRIDEKYIEDNYDILLSSLYSDRQVAVKKFKMKSAAYTAIAAGRLLQDVVSRELGLIPDEIEILRGKNGKPYLVGYENFHFNISHSGAYVVMIYGKCEVGIDIEQVRMISMSDDEETIAKYKACVERDMRVAKRYFCENEIDYIENNNPRWYEISDGHECAPLNVNFALTWTMKESYVKMDGCGISIPLKSFEIDYDKACVKDKSAYYRYFQQDNYIICVCTNKKVECKLVYEKEWITCLIKDD